jgi:acetolactate synthase-1/2/3 large subunit
MGYGLGAALGAKAADKSKEVLLITGDGSFHMNLNELSTAVNMDLPVTVLIMNNGVLGMVRQWQKLFYERRFSNTTLNRKTDYTGIAKAFGGVGYRADNLADLEKILKERPKNKTVVIDCVIDPDENVLPMIPPGKTANDIITELN